MAKKPMLFDGYHINSVILHSNTHFTKKPNFLIVAYTKNRFFVLFKLVKKSNYEAWKDSSVVGNDADFRL